MSRNAIWFAVVLATLAGCSESDNYESRQMDLAQSGAWSIPGGIVSQANSYAIGYTGAGPWVGTSGCSGSFTSGAQILKDWTLANWPQVTSIGGYACRAIVGNSSSMSVHGTGRAIDIMIPTDGGQADNGLGDPLANYLVEHADELGIQMVIWDRWLWSPSRSPRSRAYSGSHPHHDHLHVELTPQASRMELPWYQGGATAPQATACDPIPSTGRAIDETDSCFVAFGASKYWRRESDGMGGSLLWTNAWQSSTPSNWARWNFDIEEAGLYVVEYYRTSNFAMFDSTRYRVRAGGTETDVYLDQSAGSSGWEEIGTFSFAAGNNQWAAIFDNTPGSVESDQHIVVDALRIRPAGAPPAVVVDEPDTGGSSTGGSSTGGAPSSPGGTSGGTDDGNVNVNGAGAGDYGTSSEDPVPPKEAYDPEESHDHGDPTQGDTELVFEDTPADVHLDGHSCSVASGPEDGTGLLLLLGFLGLRRRR